MKFSIYKCLYNLTVLSPLLSHSFTTQGEHIHCYALATYADQYGLNRENLEVPDELIDFLELSTRVTPSKLAKFSGLTHVFEKEVQQYLFKVENVFAGESLHTTPQ